MTPINRVKGFLLRYCVSRATLMGMECETFLLLSSFKLPFPVLYMYPVSHILYSHNNRVGVNNPSSISIIEQTKSVTSSYSQFQKYSSLQVPSPAPSHPPLPPAFPHPIPCCCCFRSFLVFRHAINPSPLGNLSPGVDVFCCRLYSRVTLNH